MTETYELRCQLTQTDVAALLDLAEYTNVSDNFTAAESAALAKITSAIDPTPPPPLYPSADVAIPSPSDIQRQL